MTPSRGKPPCAICGGPSRWTMPPAAERLCDDCFGAGSQTPAMKEHFARRLGEVLAADTTLAEDLARLSEFGVEARVSHR